MNKLEEQLIRIALDAGAYKAEIIPQENIILSETFRTMCEANSCGEYGKNWVCPPHQGDIFELMDRIRSFPKGMLYQSVGDIEDSFDFEGMMRVAEEHAKMCQLIQDQCAPLLTKLSFHLSAGGCRMCRRCAILDDLPCRFPEKTIGPMEGAGIDVFKTCQSTSLEYINGQNTVTYFGILLFQD